LQCNCLSCRLNHRALLATTLKNMNVLKALGASFAVDVLNN